MLSSTSKVFIPHQVTKSERDQEGAPFDLKWLAAHFNFDDSDVEKAEFDSIGVMFEVQFKKGKELIAEQFYNKLVGNDCYPKRYEFNNSVCLNKHLKKEILSAGNSDQPLISQGKSEKSNIINTLAIRDQISLPTSSFEAIFDATFSKKKLEAPFELSWLQENYKLDLKQVKKAGFSFLGLGFEVEFKRQESLALNAFMAVLVEVGCNPKYNRFSNSVELKEMQKEKLLIGAVLGRNFIPPIENEAATDITLRKGISLARSFCDVLPSAQQMNQFYAQDQDSSWVQICGARYQMDNAHIDHFLKQISPHLSFLKEILSNPDYKKKLEYFFITEKNLISKLEKFVNHENTWSLHQALLYNC
ncbi:MAG: hypothetical protein K2X08_07190 [Chlamydiales bacterium]|nr:hypothetical protein [Chlamydiales bacterium]